MPQIHKALLLALLCAAAAPGMALAQTGSEASLQQRLDSLERRVLELERRLLKIENPERGTQPVQRGTTGDSRDIASWRQLREGMTYAEVRALLGEPTRVDGGSMAYWYFPRNGLVAFVSGAVMSWREPTQQ